MLDHELAVLSIRFGQHFASPASDHLIAYSPIQTKVDHQNSAGINLSYSTPLDFWFAALGLLDISEMEMVVFHHARKLIFAHADKRPFPV